MGDTTYVLSKTDKRREIEVRSSLSVFYGFHFSPAWVAEGDCKSISRIVRFRNVFQFEERFHHQLYLRLVGAPIICQCLFHFKRSVTKDANTLVLQCQYDAPAGLSDRNDGLLILEKEKFFDSRFARFVFLYDGRKIAGYF